VLAFAEPDGHVRRSALRQIIGYRSEKHPIDAAGIIPLSGSPDHLSRLIDLMHLMDPIDLAAPFGAGVVFGSGPAACFWLTATRQRGSLGTRHLTQESQLALTALLTG
jgi:hypothetical protein